MRVLFLFAAASLALSAFIILSSPAEGERWEASLHILVNGDEVPIPSGAGSPGMKALGDGIVSIRAGSPPEERTLGRFFESWGVRFSERCLFQYCNEDLRMYVNGKESFEFGSHVLEDADDIVLSVTVF